MAALKRLRYTFATSDTEHTVMVIPLDRSKAFRLLEENGISGDDIRGIELELAFAFIAGTREGRIAESDFMTWAETVEAIKEIPDAPASPGEAGATPAS